MRAAPAVIAVLLAGAGGIGRAQEVPADPHLSALPRTPAEAARVAEMLAPLAGYDLAEPRESLPGGTATVMGGFGREAFSQPSAGLGAGALTAFELGNILFRKLRVAAPAPTPDSDGLGPLYNARSCEACHRRDGRGAVPDGIPATRGLVLRLALPGGTAAEPDPVYGRQLQDAAVPGQTAEGQVSITYAERPVILADGTIVSLRRPVYRIADAAFGPLSDGPILAPRLAPPMIGLGLLEAIPAADILARADPGDADGDGISGRANLVDCAEFGQPMLGRFGWKATEPTIRAQIAAALADDMGLSNPLRPDPWGDCTAAQAACRDGPHGQAPGLHDGLEVDGESLDLLTLYSRNLAVPERPSAANKQVLRGKARFAAAGCPACHVPKSVTARLPDRPEQSFQLIWPYSDLLLHDMGEGLADGRPEGLATGSEWRTPPLWGIGRTHAVAGREAYLHDGRARSLLEAILWHGGEAQAARNRVIALSAEERRALLDFLQSL
jgi:CxxC motif-containing protein (DUF1111 family)